MNLMTLPREDRLKAIKDIMAAARELGVYGVAGECGELAVAMKHALFDGQAEVVAGLNAGFSQESTSQNRHQIRLPVLTVYKIRIAKELQARITGNLNYELEEQRGGHISG